MAKTTLFKIKKRGNQNSVTYEVQLKLQPAH